MEPASRVSSEHLFCTALMTLSLLNDDGDQLIQMSTMLDGND